MIGRTVQNAAGCGNHRPYGHRTTLAYDTNGYLSQITNPNDESVAMTYTERGLLTSFTTPKGATSRMEYDATGRLTRDEDAEQGSKTLKRLPDGVVEVTTAEGRSARYGWKRGANGAWSRFRADLSAGTEGSTEQRPDGTQYGQARRGSQRRRGDSLRIRRAR